MTKKTREQTLYGSFFYKPHTNHNILELSKNFLQIIYIKTLDTYFRILQEKNFLRKYLQLKYGWFYQFLWTSSALNSLSPVVLIRSVLVFFIIQIFKSNFKELEKKIFFAMFLTLRTIYCLHRFYLPFPQLESIQKNTIFFLVISTTKFFLQ